MSVVIVGGNECMERRYRELCESYNCRVKIFTKLKCDMKTKIGKPDLLVLFTGTMSHKMVNCALSENKYTDTKIEKSKTASLSSLKSILQKHTSAENI